MVIVLLLGLMGVSAAVLLALGVIADAVARRDGLDVPRRACEYPRSCSR